MGRLMHRFTNAIRDISSEVTDNQTITTSESSSTLQLKHRSRKRGLLTEKLYKEESLSASENECGRPSGSQSIRPVSEKSADRIVINVGGTRHETHRATLKLYPDTRLGWLSIDKNDINDAYDSGLNEYFFDRHPTAFNQIINFYRTGKLHAPADICGPLFEEELQFWGLDEKTMEPCCWPKYTEHRDAQENLKVFDSPLLNPQDEEDEHPIISINNPALYKEREENQNFFSRFFKKPSFFRSIRWLRAKKSIWAVMEGRSEKHPLLAKILYFVQLIFVLLSVSSLFFHSMLLVKTDDTEKHELFSYLLLTLDYLTFAWFTIELLVCLVTCSNRISFLLSVVTFIDLLTLITYAVQFQHGLDYHKPNEEFMNSDVIKTDYKNIEIFSIIRLIRLQKFFRLSIGLQIFKHTLIASSKELLLLVMLLLIPVATFASVVYFFEREVDSGKFKTIPESFWWAMITITTVGYGDMSPQTTWGKIFGIICAVFSVLILALPVSIIGNNFTLFYNYAQARMKLPKREKIALVGAANGLIAETSQHSMTPDIAESEAGDLTNNEEDAEKYASRIGLPKINLGSDPDFNANITSKRFHRERLSLFASAPARHSIRRSKSIGTATAGKVRKRQRNTAGKASKNKFRLSDEDASDTGSEKLDVFKPVSFDNGAFDHSGDKKLEIGKEEKELRVHTYEDKNTAIRNTSNPVPVIETNFTDAEEKEKNLHLINGHGPPILKAPENSDNDKFYKKICSPPVLRKISGNGVIPGSNNLPVGDIESVSCYEGRSKKYSNNHLHVPNV